VALAAGRLAAEAVAEAAAEAAVKRNSEFAASSSFFGWGSMA